MALHTRDFGSGFDALRRVLAKVLDESSTPHATLAGAAAGASPTSPRTSPAPRWLLAQAATEQPTGAPGPGPGGPSDRELATSSAADENKGRRIIALVELARAGDKEAFGLLYDHYQPSVYRFLYYRVGSAHLAEDLTGDTFFRALRSMNGFRWQGRDFGAWLMTIARNLVADHFKAGRTRLEQSTEDLGTLDSPTGEGPESLVLESLTNEELLGALRTLPRDQQDCLVMRFLQGLSLAETAAALDRTAGAVKQLQLRAVRHLATLLPDELR